MSVFASIRRSACLIASTLALASAAVAPTSFAQELPIEKVTGSELRQALIWTSHLELWDGDPAAAMQKATKSWQAAKGYQQTEKLSEDEANELMAEAVRHRNAVGSSILQDKAVGLSVGVPTKLVKMAATRTMNGGTIYDFDGKVGFVLGIRYGDFTCSNFGSYYAWVQRRLFTKTTWKAMSYDTFAVFEKKNGQQTYFQATCRTSGVAFASISMTDTQAQSYGELFGALADSLIVSRTFNPTAVPKPKVDEDESGEGEDLPTDVVDLQQVEEAAAQCRRRGQDRAHRAAGARRRRSLDPRGVRQGVGRGLRREGAAQDGLGRGDQRPRAPDQLPCRRRIAQRHDRPRQEGAERHRGVDEHRRRPLRAACREQAAELGEGAALRRHQDRRARHHGRHAARLELTVAEGLVSSKRTHKGSKLVQTSAPISHGSSGGGLFDARGELLGITTFYFAGGQNLNFAVAAEDFAK